MIALTLFKFCNTQNVTYIIVVADLYRWLDGILRYVGAAIFFHLDT